MLIQTSELKVGGVYKSAAGFQVRCLMRTPEGVPVLLQYTKGDLNKELGVYRATNTSLPFEVVHESPEDQDADTDF
jgi:hypothetical protein